MGMSIGEMSFGALLLGLVTQLGQVLLVVALAPAVTGLVRKTKARLQGRVGPSILQPYRDLRRLFGKEVVLSDTTSWLFRSAPYAIFAATWVAAALVPSFETGLLFSWSGDLIAIVALLGLARFLHAIAAIDSGTAFGGIGASREVMVASLAEPAMIMVVFTVSLVAGATQLSTIAHFMVATGGLRVSLAMALFALVIVALAENTRIPIDNPATHLELTMVHEAMVLEYSGRHLAVVELAASLRLLLYLSLIACIFAPFGLVAGGASLMAQAAALLLYLLKVAVGCVLLAISETSVAKMRVFRVPNLLGIALMLGLLGTLLLFVSGGL
jgi:formate hydrogenlyase subunit 4